MSVRTPDTLWLLQSKTHFSSNPQLTGFVRWSAEWAVTLLFRLKLFFFYSSKDWIQTASPHPNCHTPQPATPVEMCLCLTKLKFVGFYSKISLVITSLRFDFSLCLNYKNLLVTCFLLNLSKHQIKTLCPNAPTSSQKYSISVVTTK